MKISSQFSVGYSFSTLPYQSIIKGNCNHGYESTNIKERKCNRNGTWTGQNLICSPVRCNFPGDIKNGVYIFSNGSQYISGTIAFNESLSIKCNTGYEIEGRNQTKCQSDKTWSFTKPICTVKKCKDPGQFQNGYYEFKSPVVQDSSDPTPLKETIKLEVLTKIYIKCSVGYFLNSTNNSRTCLESGKWSSETLECVPVYCQWPLHVNGGYYVPSQNSTGEGMPYNTTLTAECNKTFKLSYSYRTRRCNEDGHWSKDPAICESFDADEETKDNVGVIIGVAVTVPIVLFSSLALAVFFYHRSFRKSITRKQPAAVKKGNGPKGTDNNPATGSSRLVIDNKDVSKDSAQMENQNYACSNTSLEIYEEISFQKERVCYNFTDKDKIPKSAIKVKDLSDFVLHGNNAKAKFEKQFKRLPQGMTKSHTEALLPKNRGKNRYRGLYAWDTDDDDTRVVLETDEATKTDYINACYVLGYDKKQKYIASQGPTKEILGDFWNMIWQEDCCKIVMLTNLSEEGKTKCEQYWPDKYSEKYGKITVTLETTEIFSQFVIRTLMIQKNNSVSRSVTQFHFTAWPDKGVPKYASSLVNFLHKVKHTPAVKAGPIVVHCSAGIGRTGTYIALDILTEQGNTMEYIDVLGTISSLRQQRVNLVQTLEQYIFVHHALVESLMLPTSALSAAKFPEAYKDLLEMDERKGKRKICVEFETLNKVSPTADEKEECMPSLTSRDGIRDKSYINAVFLPSYKEKRAFIITQSPMESTNDDFWRLIWEHNVHTLVMMNNQNELQDSEIYWPRETEVINYGHIAIRNDGNEKIDNHQVLSLTVKNNEQVRYIKMFQCGGWQSERNIPDSPDVILGLMELVLTWQQQSGNHTILVHCLNGADKSGLFCVISAVIERMKIEQDVAIPQVIEEMRSARKQIIPSIEQYMFCHEAALMFLNKYDTYANFAA